MNAATLKALKASIAHWERMATRKEKPGECPSRAFCELCAKFWDEEERCKGCPVQEAAESICDGTPYWDAWDAFRISGFSLWFRRLAAKERDFLVSLLPKEKP